MHPTTIGATLADAYDGHHGWAGGWMWLWGSFMMVALVALVVYVLRSGLGSSGDSQPAAGAVDGAKKAREILSERYARGEINADEYREKLHDLGGRVENRSP